MLDLRIHHRDPHMQGVMRLSRKALLFFLRRGSFSIRRLFETTDGTLITFLLVFWLSGQNDIPQQAI